MRPAGRTGVVAVLSATLFCGAAVGETYWVATGGSDSAAGGKGAPWRTIQHAVDAASPGDTIIVADGEYRGFRIRRSGAKERPVTLKAANKWGAVIKGRGEQCLRDSVIEINADDDSQERISYWVLEGLDVDGTGQAIGIRPNVTTHVTISNCHLHDSDWPNIMAGHCDYMIVEDCVSHHSRKSHGIYMANSADNGILRRNTVFSNAKAGIHMNGDLSCGGDGVMTGWLVESNVIYDNALVTGGGAINCDGVSDSVFRNNLLYGNHRTGMTFYSIDASEGSSRNLVAHNTVVMAPGASWPLLMPAADRCPSPTGNRFLNNILLPGGSAEGSILIYSGKVEGLECDYNVVSGFMSVDGSDNLVGLERWRSSGLGTHSITAASEELFVDPAAGDFRLKPGSPAIGAGCPLSEVPADIDGEERARDAADIGCYTRR